MRSRDLHHDTADDEDDADDVTDVQDRSDARDHADDGDGADLPRLEGWDRCPDLSEAELRGYLRETFDPREVDPARISELRYQAGRCEEDDEDSRTLGQTLAPRDREMRDAIPCRTTVYDHDGARADVRATIAHEVGHSVWLHASPETQDAYARDVYAWSMEHDSFATGEVPTLGERLPELGEGAARFAALGSDYSRRDAEEHFCESYAMALTHPRRLMTLDSYAPETRQRGAWVQRIRGEGVGAKT